MTEKAELRTGKRNVYLVGKAKLRDDAFKIDQKSTSGYTYSSVNFGVETSEGNVVYVELMGGFTATPMPIKTKTKDHNDMEVNWQDRLNEKIVEQVADYKLLKIALVENEIGAFISSYDFIKALQGKLKDGMEVNVRGVMKHSVYKGEEQRKIEITGISLPYQKKAEDGTLLPVEYRANFVQTVLIDEDSLDITPQDIEQGETIVQAYAVDYIGKYDGEQIKANVLFPMPITVPLTGNGEKIAEKLFAVDSGKVTELTIKGNLIEGYDKSGGTEDLIIPDEIQELIDLGLYTLEDVKNKVQVRGNKVSKILFTRPNVVKDDDGKVVIQEDKEKFKVEDLVFFEQAINGEMPTKESQSNDNENGESIKEEDWLGALGV